MRTVVVIGCNAAIVVASLFAAALAPASETVAVVVPPGSDPAAAMRTVARAGGFLASTTGRDWIVVARSPDPDFVGRLYAAGAIAVLAPSGLLGCTSGE